MDTLKEILYWLAHNKWVYLAYWLPLVIFIVRFYRANKADIGKDFDSFIEWARHSLETNKEASAEKITAFIVINFVYVPGRLYFVYKIIDPLHLLYGSLIDAALVLILYKIITPANLIELKNRFPERFQVQGYYLGDILVGFMSYFVDQDTIVAHLTGFDLSRNKEFDLYLNMLLELVRCTIELCCQSLILSRTALEIKSSIGAKPRPLINLLKHRIGVIAL